MKKLLLLLTISFSLLLGIQSVSGNDFISDNVIQLTDEFESGIYQDDLVINVSVGVVIIDGEIYQSGTVYNEIGIHRLIIIVESVVTHQVDFTIIPRFDEEIDDVTFHDQFILNLENSGLVKINNGTILNGETYNKVGSHTVTVYGSNNYQVSYSIEIVNSQKEYLNLYPVYNQVTFDVSPYVAVYYENEKLTGNITFDEIGYYYLKLLTVDGEIEYLRITLAHSTNRFTSNGEYANSLLISKGTAVKWYIDNTEQKNGFNSTFITKVGNHSVKFVGKNGYQKTYNITITEGDIDIIDGKTYKDFFQFEYSDYTVKLNNIRYTSGSQKTIGGNYEVTINGANGYVSRYNIFIEAEVPFTYKEGLDNVEIITESINLDQNFQSIYVNGEEVENYRFSKSGIYRIVYQGAGDYLEAYTIEYHNEHEVVQDYVLLGGLSFSALLVTTYLFLGWRRFK